MGFTNWKWEGMRDYTVIEKSISPITGEHYIQKVANVFGQTESFQVRNTLLIAAAPDMYEALKRIITIGFSHFNQDDIDMAVRAIAKAECRIS